MHDNTCTLKPALETNHHEMTQTTQYDIEGRNNMVRRHGVKDIRV